MRPDERAQAPQQADVRNALFCMFCLGAAALRKIGLLHGVFFNLKAGSWPGRTAAVQSFSKAQAGAQS